MDLQRLRQLLEQEIAALKDRHTAQVLTGLCEKLELGDLSTAPGGSKRERLRALFDAVPDESLPRLGERVLVHCAPRSSVRIEVEDILRADEPGPQISKRARREIGRALSPEDLYIEPQAFDALLDQLFVLEEGAESAFAALVGTHDPSLRAQIARHVHRNPGDWSPEKLFGALGAYDCSDRRFRRLLEGLASASVRPDVAGQRRFVAVVNSVLREHGAELREMDTDGGYPAFSVASLRHLLMAKPKNLIFASTTKPDLRLRDAIANEVEIVSGADTVLIYDRPIGPAGLPWRDLQAWWADRERAPDERTAKKTLYRRLERCLPAESPPQRLLFETFFQTFKAAVLDLPALLPEVHLHWDPKTVKERGAEALLRQRMDFLLLLPADVRVVVEVDGKHHYSDAEGRGDATKYAAMVAADRELRLLGYELFRFGALELNGVRGVQCARDFFVGLFRRFGVRVGAR